MFSSDRPDPIVPDSIRSDPTYAAQRDLICKPHLSEPNKCEIEEDFRSGPTRPDRPQPDPIRPDWIYKAQLKLTCTPLLSEVGDTCSQTSVASKTLKLRNFEALKL